MNLPIADHPIIAGAVAPRERARQLRRPVGISLKLRLCLLITVLIAMMMVIGGAYIVEQARQDVRAEVRSTMNLTSHFLDAQLAVLQERGLGGQGYAVRLFQLRELREVRHLIINFYNDHGNLLDTNELPGDRKPDAPFWFVWLVRASTPPLEASRRTVSFNGYAVGELVIQPDPTY
jgi:two-component system sensor histidine kinase UhpB